MNTQDWSPLGWTGWLSLSKGLSRVFSNTTVQKHQFFNAQLSAQPNSHIHTWLLEKPQPWLDGLLDETSLVAQRVKASADNVGDLGLIPGWGTTPWRSKWQPTPLFLSRKSHRIFIEEPGRLQSMGWQRVGHYWATSLHLTRWNFVGKVSLCFLICCLGWP